MWFEKFHWFISTENYIVIAGRDAQQNEVLVYFSLFLSLSLSLCYLSSLVLSYILVTVLLILISSFSCGDICVKATCTCTRTYTARPAA